MLNRFAFTAIFLHSPAAFAQETHGYINGRVLDPAAAPIAGIPVTVTSTNTNAVTRVSTNATGYYEANLLPPGTYQVSAEAPGFKRIVRSGITLAVGAHLDIELTLEIGQVSESVSVTAEAPLLESGSGSSGRVIDSQVLSDVPVLNNMSLLLAEMTPGVQSAGVNSWVSYH